MTKDIKGFTLIELMVALAILSIVIAGIYTIYNSQLKSYIVQEQVVDSQQNLRIAMNIISRDIRNAGGNISLLCGATATEGIGSVIEPNDGGADNPDSLTVTTIYLSPVKTMTTAAINQADATFPVEDTTGWAEGQSGIIMDCTVNPAIFTIFRVAAVAGGLEHASASDVNSRDGLSHTYPAGSPVAMLDKTNRRVTYAIDTTVPLNPQLTIDENNGSGAQPLAMNIEDMQFSYIIKQDDDTLVEENAPAATGRIRSVNISLLARTDRTDSKWTVGSQPLLGNRTVQLDYTTTDLNINQYRRRILQSTELVRNFAFVDRQK